MSSLPIELSAPPASAAALGSQRLYLRGMLYVGFGIALLTGFLLLGADSRESLIVYTLLLLAYCVYEVRRERRLAPGRWALDPAVAVTIIVFILGFCISNLPYLDPNSELSFFAEYWFAGDSTYRWLNTALFYAMLSVFAMWRGYRLQASRTLGDWLASLLHVKHVLRREPRLRWTVIPIMIGAAVVARLVQIQIGVFGYASDVTALQVYAPIRAYLDAATMLTKLLLVAAWLCYFATPPAQRTFRLRFLAYGLLGYEVLFGFLSGFKSAVVLPIVLVGACQYAIRREVPRRLILLAVGALILSYIVIEPFRAARYKDPEFSGRTAGDIATLMLSTSSASTGEGPATVVWRHTSAAVARSSSLVYAALAVRHAEEVGLSPDAPAFARNLYLVPVLAFVPRLLWPSKPLSNIGNWFANEVLHQNTTVNSIAFSPVGYLYFAGGGIAVFLGFLVLGGLLRVIQTLFGDPTVGAQMVFIGLLPTLVGLEQLHASLAGLLQQVPQLMLAQWLIFRASRGS